MPQASGFELIERVRTELLLNTPFATMSMDDGDVRLKSLRSNVQFFAKPIRPDALQTLWQAATPASAPLAMPRNASARSLDEASRPELSRSGHELSRSASAASDMSRATAEAFGPSSSRVDRLLKERELRRVRSATGLHEGDLPAALSSVSLADGPEGLPLESDRGELLDEAELDGAEEPRQRLLVVANRLPVSAKKLADGSWSLEARRAFAAASCR